jgi:hypothetical protein
MGGDPMSIITGLLSSLNSFFSGQQLSDLQNRVFGQQEAATSFAQDPNQMNQFITALQRPYSFQNTATPQAGQQAAQYFGGFQTPYGAVATPGTAGAVNQYLGGYQTPYASQLAAQQAGGVPGQAGSLVDQYTQGLNAALTSNVWNQVQNQLGQSGMTQAPGVGAYNYAQALAPYYQQNIGTAAQMMQQPMNWYQQQQQYGLAAGQQPFNWLANQQGYGLQAGGVPLQYQFGTAQLGLGEAQNALQYPFNIGSQLAGAFPNYSTAYSPGTTP